MLAPWLWVWLGLDVLKDYRLTILIYEGLGCALPLLWFRPRLPAFHPLRLSPGVIVLGALFLNVLILGIFKATHGFQMDWPEFHRQAERTRLVVDGWFWFYAAVIILVNPVLEEAFWRGFIFREWKKRFGVGRAALISGFFFGAWHWLVLQHYSQPVWAVALTLLVMLGGIILAWTQEKTGTLGAATLVHGLGTDLPMVFVVYDCILQGGAFKGGF